MKTEKKIPANPVSNSESTTVPQRFRVLIDVLDLSPNQFAKELEMASTQIYAVLNGRNAPSHKMYEAIMLRFPEVNIDYVIVDRGSPLKPTKKDLLVGAKNTSTLNNVVKELTEMKEVRQELIAEEVAKFMMSAAAMSKQLKKKKVKNR